MTEWDPYEWFARDFTKLRKADQRTYVGQRLLGVAGPPALNAPQGEEPEDFLIWLYPRLEKRHPRNAAWMDQGVADALAHFRAQIEKGHADREAPYLRACRVAVEAGLDRAAEEMASQLADEARGRLSPFARTLSGAARAEVLALLPRVLKPKRFWRRLWDARSEAHVDQAVLLKAAAMHAPEQTAAMICDYFAVGLPPADAGDLEIRQQATQLAGALEHALARGEEPLSPLAVEQMARALARADRRQSGRRVFEEVCHVLDRSAAARALDLDDTLATFARRLDAELREVRSAETMKRILAERLRRTNGEPERIYAPGHPGDRWAA